MSVTISATFETVDSADFALAALKREGMEVERHSETAPRHAVVGFTNMSAATSLVYDEVLGAMEPRRYNDIHSGETTMRVTVPSERASEAEGILISLGGYRLRQSAE
ncbi:hypothetical protein FACS18949_07880 [Clostridia bacterium]|nr:hypothetical protein FACS18949_07880 [Clostridia bacterium]